MQHKQHNTMLTNLFNNDTTTSHCDEISYVLFIHAYNVFIIFIQYSTTMCVLYKLLVKYDSVISVHFYYLLMK